MFCFFLICVAFATSSYSALISSLGAFKGLVLNAQVFYIKVLGFNVKSHFQQNSSGFSLVSLDLRLKKFQKNKQYDLNCNYNKSSNLFYPLLFFVIQLHVCIEAFYLGWLYTKLKRRSLAARRTSFHPDWSTVSSRIDFLKLISEFRIFVDMI